MQLYNTLSNIERSELIQQAGKERLTISFYKYSKISNPELLRNHLFLFWDSIDVLGRIYVAHEGINAQLSVPADNFEAFKNKLNVNKLHKEVYAFYKDHEKFANEMDTILLEKKGKLDNAINTLEDKLEQWKKVRKWENEISRSLLKQPDELDRLLKKLCHEETTRDFYKGPRGKSLQMLDMSKEYCKNLLNAGQSLATVWKTIDLEMSKEKINTSTIPKPEFLAITK